MSVEGGRERREGRGGEGRGGEGRGGEGREGGRQGGREAGREGGEGREGERDDCYTYSNGTTICK